MYRNRERLARALAVCVEHYGPDVLRDSQRTRNLLVDEFGGDNLADRSDIEQFVSVLNAAQASVTRPDLPVSSAAAAAAAAAGVTLDDAAWTITTLRSLTARLPPESPRPGGNGRLGPVGPTVLEPDDVAVVPAAPPPRRWPTAAKVAVTVIACLAVAAIAAGGVLLARSRSDVDRLRKDRATALDTSASSDGRVDELDHQLDQAKAAAADAQRALQDATAQASTATATMTDLQAKVDAANAAVVDLTAQRDAANSSVASLQQQLDAANQLAAPFGVGQGGVAVPTSRFTFAGDTTVCEGFGSAECSGYRSFRGYIRQDGASKWFEIPNVVRIPLSSDNGLRYSGQEGTSGTGVNCQGVPLEAIFTVAIEPMDFGADPQTRQITATRYGASVEINSPGGGRCTDAARQAFAGVLTFEGY